MNDPRYTAATAVVVGAGVIGTGIALELARAGYAVQVVERAAVPGAGSTSASSAIVRFHYRHRDEVVLAWESGRRWLHWRDYLRAEDPAGLAAFIPTGLLLLPGTLVSVAESLHHMASLGIEVEALTPAAVAQRFPAIDPARFGPPALPDDAAFWSPGEPGDPAYWMPQCGYVDDPQLAAHNLAHAAAAAGAVFHYGMTVVGVTRRSGRVAGVACADGSTLSARVVVNAAGPWSAGLNDLADVLDDFTTSTKPLVQEVISMPAPAGMGVGEGPAVTDGDLGTYFRPQAGGSLIVGGMEAPCDPLQWLEEPAASPADVSLQTYEMQSMRVARRLPGAAVTGRARGVVGVYDVTEDWIPIYDRTSLPGFYVAIGTSGHGFKQAPFVGALMAELITACEAGHPHDEKPVTVTGPASGAQLNLGHFSRRRSVVAQEAMG